MADEYLIYALQDPISGELRYIGKSCRGLKRIQSHKRANENLTSHRTRWIKKLKAQGFMFNTIIVQILPNKEDLRQAEIYWIGYFRAVGCPLTNMSHGGEGVGHRLSHEAIQKMRETKRQKSLNGWTDPKRGITRSEENRKAISIGTKLGMTRPEVKEKIYRAHLNRATRIQDQNGIIYSSVKAAADQLHIERSGIFSVLNGTFAQIKGYKFTRC